MEGFVEDIEEGEGRSRQFGLWFIIKNVIYLIAGLVLLIFPGFGLAVVAFLAGVVILLQGGEQFYYTIKYRTSLSSRKALFYKLLRSLVQIFIALLLVSHPLGMVSMGLSILFFIAGLFLVLSAIADILWNISDESDLQSRSKTIFFLVFGAALMISPLFSVNLIFRIIGFLMAANAVSNGISGIRHFKKEA